MIQKHPENDLPHDENRVAASVEITVGSSVIQHPESVAAGGSGNGLGNAGEAVGQRSRHDVMTLPEAQPASGDRDADHQQHQSVISARRASSLHAGDDETTVIGAVRSAGHVSGIEITGAESSAENLAEPKNDPESRDDYHLSGTIVFSQVFENKLKNVFQRFRIHPNIPLLSAYAVQLGSTAKHQTRLGIAVRDMGQSPRAPGRKTAFALFLVFHAGFPGLPF